ncbi:hypothetical protein OS493_006259 [Desmophyllum pertusum]|uniref:Uncharacterized protein n=1 Tax=Desmophyllum pertusum TaxID=174260 RepID=A0A9X0A597_9CNID|nr:hypothetical protein OS493_006259 [Desmophyllum pertusum]
MSLACSPVGNAVVIALAQFQGNNEGNSTVVYCLEVVGNLENEKEFHVIRQPFPLYNQVGNVVVWSNNQLRNEVVARGTVISFQRIQSASLLCEAYRGNVGKVLDMNMVLSKLQFGHQGYNGVAYRGIREARPDVVVTDRGIITQQYNWPNPCIILIGVQDAKTLDGRVIFKTIQGEVYSLKNNCRNYMQSTIDEVTLPVQVPRSLNDVGSFVLVSLQMANMSGQYLQAVCEGILISSANLSTQTPGLQTYEMSSNPRGLCFIINNLIFQHEADNRHGAEFDKAALKALFKELFFAVRVIKNLTANEMRQVAIDVAGEDHSAFDAFVFIIMSHGGDHDQIYGVDGRPVKIEELMSEFIATKCPTLQNKPKLFIFQSCRGSSTESMVPTNCHIDPVPGFSADSTLARGTCPQEADFLLAFAAAPGYYSYRNPKSGSLFIQVLVNVIRTHHHDSHLSELLQEVTRQVAERGTTTPAVQVPAHSNTLRAKLYL